MEFSLLKSIRDKFTVPKQTYYNFNTIAKAFRVET